MSVCVFVCVCAYRCVCVSMYVNDFLNIKIRKHHKQTSKQDDIAQLVFSLKVKHNSTFRCSYNLKPQFTIT